MNANVIPSAQGVYDAPHQKIVIVDGLVAFKGSTNLTNAGAVRWKPALNAHAISFADRMPAAEER